MFILGRRADYFGLKKSTAILFGLILGIDILIFPWALRSGWLWLWLSLTFLYIFFASFYSGLPKSLSLIGTKKKLDNEQSEMLKMIELVSESNKENDFNATPPKTSEIEDTIVENVILDTHDESNSITEDMEETITGSCIGEETYCTSNLELAMVSVEELSIDNLIEMGFEDKNSGDFTKAAEFFTNALKLRPSSDLAMSLVMDIYWLGIVTGHSDFGKEQLNLFGREYYNKLTPDMQSYFADWMKRGHLTW